MCECDIAHLLMVHPSYMYACVYIPLCTGVLPTAINTQSHRCACVCGMLCTLLSSCRLSTDDDCVCSCRVAEDVDIPGCAHTAERVHVFASGNTLMLLAADGDTDRSAESEGHRGDADPACATGEVYVYAIDDVD